MNKVFSVLILLSIFTAQAGIQTGNLTFNNTLTQPIHYEYSSTASGSVPGIIAGERGLRIKGRGDVPANARNFDIRSSMKSAGQNVWGDTIEFTLSRNSNESQAFAINQLGAYVIGVDSNNKLTLTKN